MTRSPYTSVPNITAAAWIAHKTKATNILVPDLATALNLRDEISLYSPQTKTFVLPRVESDLLRNRGPSALKRFERIRFFSSLYGLYPNLEQNHHVHLFCVDGLFQKTPHKDFWTRHGIKIKRGQTLDRQTLTDTCVDLGYLPADLVEHEGSMATRGFIVDIFCPLYDHPLRLEFDGDEITSIKTFHHESQRTLMNLSEVIISPVREFVFNDDPDATKSRFRRFLDDQDWESAERQSLLSRVQQKSFFATIDYWAPLLNAPADGDYSILDSSSILKMDLLVEPQRFVIEATDTDKAIQKNFVDALEEKEWVPTRDLLFASSQEVLSLIKPLQESSIPVLSSRPFVATSPAEPKESPIEVSGLEYLFGKLVEFRKNKKEALLEPLAEALREWQALGFKVVFCAHNPSQIERAQFLLAAYGLQLTQVDHFPDAVAAPHFFTAIVHHAESSFEDKQNKIVVLTDHQVLGLHSKKPTKSTKTRSSANLAIDSLRFIELKPGDLVVHHIHGIGQFLGTRQMLFEGFPTELLEIEYKDSNKLLVPVTKLQSIQKFSGASEEASLDRLGGQSWEQKKSKVKKELQSIAGELLNLYSQRSLSKGPTIAPPKEKILEFAASFPYQETPDQQQAIDACLQDLEGPRPMDRLLCGDVGFGKTEVAMRVAHAAVAAGYQVAVLVPTTLLAHQHESTLTKRFSPFGVVVRSVSRFKSTKEFKNILTEVEEGRVNILIGTHKLLSSQITFKKLGLLVVDEEQRFGVAHKEKLKKFKTNIHVLSMTATPIPRTLNMTMSGLKELSIMQTPPQDRLSVRTYISKKKGALIQDAILKEVQRGGQVYYIHNRVQTILRELEEIRKLVPEISIDVAHGQMDGTTLEKKMLAFFEGRTQVLISTAIVESGLDVSNANTLIVDRADTFGLAQLYQLRGRVGRSTQRAYAYLLLPERGEITADAEERLSVMESYQELGSGFYIASHDLEIRGAGDILGRNQSGQISLIGFETYSELLSECVAELRGEPIEKLVEPELKVDIDTHIPEYYIPETGLRLMLYRRLAAAVDEDEIHNTEKEIDDRFGALPVSVRNLVAVMRVKCQLRRLGVRALTAGKVGFSVLFDSQTPVDTAKLVESIKRYPNHFILSPDGKLIIKRSELSDSSQLLRGLESALSQLEAWVT